MFYLVYLRVDLLEEKLEYDVLHCRNFLISDNTFPQAVLNFAVSALLLKLLITRDIFQTELRYLSPQSRSFTVLASPLPLSILKVPQNGERPQTNLNS